MYKSQINFAFNGIFYKTNAAFVAVLQPGDRL